ncbi:STAS/SEC14 domain-containing protein [Phormidium tenue FACHB-886]|nr:STAS/SEC14 domain-containing protein [Phormidium tenue FACHB-886]
MYQILDESSGRVIGIKLSGTLTEAEYQTLIQLIEAFIIEHGRARMVWHLEEFEGETLDPLWRGLKLNADRRSSVERLAIIGERSPEQWMGELVHLVAQGKVKHFPQSALDAWVWVRQG